MNPVLVFLVIVGAVILWFLLSFIFYPIGKFTYKIYKDAIDEINKQEKTEMENEKELD